MSDEMDRQPTLLDQQADWLSNYQFGLRISEHGNVVSIGDGIAWISGLPSATMDEVLNFEDGSQGMVFDLTPELIGVVLLHETDTLTSGMSVRVTGHRLSIPVGDSLLGRIIDPLGTPLDDLPKPEHYSFQPVESASPAIIARGFVQKPLYTGCKIIDTMMPIGKGQRQLIIGDEGLGRSSIAIDTVLNQTGKNVYCVYVLIGQKLSTIVNCIDTLRQHNALEYTTVVVAKASALPGLQYLAPFSGCSVAEYWMNKGQDTLVVYDDLSTHAKTYRELSLLLRRPPGREAYPGDIFSVHARLLERSTMLNMAHGGGSMTALPIVVTNQGEIAAYIPTNLISITDGQIYLDCELFAAGFRPAIDIARSVSRIGGQAQHPSIKDEAGRMKLDYLQFLELEVFTRFGAKVEASIEAAIKRGSLLREIFKQERLEPMPVEFQLAWLIAYNEGLLDDVNPDSLPEILNDMASSVQQSELILNSERSLWVKAIGIWLDAFNRTAS
ncbi:MAG: F0F1 ATP synthase subunit alpha [Gammaproteobacteria bacterium]|nr:F0F1 ATP synthase subunit alpha [Gammaproteobacteria bacterium]